MRSIQFGFVSVLALISTQAFAWQKGYPFPTDLSIPLGRTPQHPSMV